ncbi:FlgK family flagellar hook-associated protein [Glacieibacterium frigidum]|uniref:Flagellar hook-associated protein 1 n=1 Tax=Glacieibacterium frigidum TaxID=2593303 RepID=A0A552UET1_9SPHN|nr:flagellar basal body rod C-terminal domain-containing protein [Glacieibacterium frigidum]TRW16679.1 hypothetical protein FMM06_00210 [Glacieibacterium frigidum]
MTDLIALGAAGVRAYARGLEVVGDNVANAESPGYVRRTITPASARAGPGTPLSRDLASAGGVDPGIATRAYDALKAKAARNAGGDAARLDARADWLTRLQATVGGDTARLDGALGGFYDGAQDLAANPRSTAARTIFLDRADQAAAAFRGAAESIDGLQSDLAAATEAATSEVNGLTTSLAAVNVELKRASGSRTTGGAAANALLDERDRLLAALSGFVRIGVTEGKGGVVTVTAGDGPAAPALVDGGTATRIAVRDGANGAELVLDPGHDARAIRLPASGTLSGLIEAARAGREILASLDTLAARFAEAANSIHAGGVDATGADGGTLFATRSLGVVPGAANAGDASVRVEIADGATLGDGYVLRRAGSGWMLARADGSGTVSGTATLTLDGVTVTPGAGARDGDSFALVARDGAGGIALRPLSAAQVAVSARWLGDGAASNAGTGRLTVTLDDSAAGLPAIGAYALRATAGGFDVLDTGGAVLGSYPTGAAVAGAGFSFRVDGAPAVGDTFRIVRAGASSADSGTVRDLLASRDVGIEDDLDATVAGLASRLSETLRLGEAASALASDAKRAQDAVSGVDLDAEAAELTRLQAAYKASAQVMATARALFDELLAVAR